MKKIIETERLLLREFAFEDAANLFLLNSNPEVMKYINLNFKITFEGSQKAVENWIKYYTLNPGLGIWPTILKEILLLDGQP
jgi:ribosomal-protein-alanine N-acetyltransferase